MATAKVSAIKLTSFQYNAEYEPAEGTEVKYTIDVLHRAHLKTNDLDILVHVKYSVIDYPETVLQASCLTSFNITGAKVAVDPADGLETMTLSHALGKRLTAEAISHARALIAVHTAATPFGTIHIDLTTVITADELQENTSKEN